MEISYQGFFGQTNIDMHTVTNGGYINELMASVYSKTISFHVSGQSTKIYCG